jgi:molybdopterin molybdotransferase
MSTFIAVEDAQEQILSGIPLTSVERVHLGAGADRFLATSIRAPWNSPRFDNSAMDGYALRWDDLTPLPATLDIAGESSAGTPADRVVQPGQAFRISTGAAIPSGADTVVPRELCEAGPERVTVEESPSKGKGANIRYAGTYLSAGDTAIMAGTQLGGAEIGLLASFGRPIIEVHARPRVGIISTGDELVDLGQTPGPGQIINSNAYMLEALVARHGGIPRVYPTAPDDRRAIAETFKRAIADCDLVLSSGGVSVGDHDHVGQVVDELCEGMTFWKVRMKPGKPLAFGRANPKGRAVPIIGLPGNPGAGFVAFHLYIRPALAVAQGASIAEAPLPQTRAILNGGARGSRGRRAYLAGRVTSEGPNLAFQPLPHQSSGNPALFAGANALGIVEEGRGRLDDGADIAVHLLS